mmetsp:Transcript_25581/g.54632  ORF Transcript_25581/g.54632 Transcript_25581/m.54632 type:complete len:208 (+) Transcript_25581:193-816(+)
MCSITGLDFDFVVPVVVEEQEEGFRASSFGACVCVCVCVCACVCACACTRVSVVAGVGSRPSCSVAVAVLSPPSLLLSPSLSPPNIDLVVGFDCRRRGGGCSRCCCRSRSSARIRLWSSSRSSCHARWCLDRVSTNLSFICVPAAPICCSMHPIIHSVRCSVFDWSFRVVAIVFGYRSCSCSCLCSSPAVVWDRRPSCSAAFVAAAL